MTSKNDHAPSAARRKRLKQVEAETGKALLNVLDSYPMDKYYAMADRLVTAFQLALDERRLDDAYVFGLRFATFSLEGLPKHSQYQRSHKMQRAKNSRQVDEVLKKMELVATRMDAEERLLERKRREAKEAKRREEEARKQEEDRKRQAEASKKQRHADILRQQREELLAQQRAQREADQAQKAKEQKQKVEQSAHEKLRLLNAGKTTATTNPSKQATAKKPTAAEAPRPKLYQASVDGSNRNLGEEKGATVKESTNAPGMKLSKATRSKRQVVEEKKSADTTNNAAPLMFPKAPTAKPKVKPSESKKPVKSSKSVAPPAKKSQPQQPQRQQQTSKPTPTIQASVFASSEQSVRRLSQQEPKKASSRSVATEVHSNYSSTGTNQQAQKEEQKSSWWDTSANAEQNAQKPWWQRDVPPPVTPATAKTEQGTGSATTTKPTIAAETGGSTVGVADTSIAQPSQPDAPGRETGRSKLASTAPIKSTLKLFQKLSPKKGASSKKIMPNNSTPLPLQPPPPKEPTAEGYEITMGSTASLQVVETEPEEDPYTEHSYRSKLTPREAKTAQLLEDTIRLQEARLERLEASNERAVLRQEAKRRLKQGDRKGALYCLAKKKRINQTIDVVKSAIFNMETQIMMLESAVESREVGMILKEASDAVTSIQGGARVSDFTDEKVGDVLAAVGQGGMEYDEEELLSELHEPSDDELTTITDDESSLLTLPSAPQDEMDPLDKHETSVSKIVASLF